MATISKELREMSQQPWFPIMMRELGYEPIKHGRWEEIDKYHLGTCSVCGDRWGSVEIMRYCPNCGAKMDGGEHE